MNSVSTANTAPVYTLHTADGKKLKTLEDNTDFNTNMLEFNLTKKEFFTIKLKMQS